MAYPANPNVLVPPRTFRAEDLKQLLAVSELPCVSIYMTTHRRFPEAKQDPTQFKTLLGKAEGEVASRMGARDANGVLDPARRFLEDEEVWGHSLDGLAVFCAPSFAAAYRVPMPVPEAVIVADSFHTKPLFRFLRQNSRYYVLAVSQNAVSLFQGSSFGAAPVDLGALPADLTAALGVSELDEDEKGKGAHGRGPANLIFHGRGPGKEDRKEILLKYFRAIDKGLHDYLREERAPLLLAAVRYCHPIYREANTYPHLLEEGLDGNYERANAEAIHAEAWPLVGRDLERRVAEWVEKYRSLVGKGLAVEGAEAVAGAVIQGRVWCVLASEDGSLPGRLDRATGQVSRQAATDAAGDADLIDDICEEAWKRGGEIYVVPKASLPTREPIAAVLRF